MLNYERTFVKFHLLMHERPGRPGLLTPALGRAFLPTPFDSAVGDERLTLAAGRPQRTHIQPWTVRVVAGETAA